MKRKPKPDQSYKWADMIGNCPLFIDTRNGLIGCISVLCDGAQDLMDKPCVRQESYAPTALDIIPQLLNALDAKKDAFVADDYESAKEAMWMFYRVFHRWQVWQLYGNRGPDYWTLPSTVVAMADSTRALRRAYYLLSNGKVVAPSSPEHLIQDIPTIAGVMGCSADAIIDRLRRNKIEPIKSDIRRNALAASVIDILNVIPQTKGWKPCRDKLQEHIKSLRPDCG